MLKRRTDWPERLGEKIEQMKGKPFVWGELDCCIFAADMIETITGVDVYAEFRGKYTTIDGAHEQIQATARSLAMAVTKTLKRYGCTRKPVNEAQRGDLVMTECGALGIVSLDGRFVLALTQSGLKEFPMSVAKTAWGIE